MGERIFILDGHYLIYRSYHAMKRAGLKDSSGRPTGAVFGLLRFLISLQKGYEPDYLVCALDSKEPTFRHEFFEDYKANRPDMPDDLRSQISLIKEIFELLDVPVLLEPGLESDDLVAGLVEKWKHLKDREIIIVSNDKDLFQLVSDKVSVLKQSRGLTDVKLLNESGVEDELGVSPERVSDFLALTGDSADNVPGVAGIGDAYAAKLLDKYGDVETILANTESIEGHLGEKIRANKQQLEESFELVQLRSDCEIDFELEDCIFEQEKFLNLKEFCANLDLNSVLRDIEDMFRSREELTTERTVDFAVVSAEELKRRLSAGEFRGIFVETDGGETKIVSAETVYLMLAADGVVEAAVVRGEEGRKLYEKVQEILVNHSCYFFGIKEFYALGFKLEVEPKLVNKPIDLKLASYLLSPEAGHSLPEVVRRQVGGEPIEPQENEEGKWLKWRATLFGSLLEVADEITERVKENKQKQILDELEQPLARELARMEHNGIKIDSQKLNEFSDELEAKLAKLTRQAHDSAGEEFNLNSPKQLREILFEKLDLEPCGKTDSGKPSTDADSLQTLSDVHDLPAIILEYRRYKKINSTYLTPLVEAVNQNTGRLHTEFNQTVTATGRLSSSNPNLQNIPVREEFGRRVREAFVPSQSNYLLIAADYSQVELRLLAHFSGDKTLINAFKEGRDVHRLTAAELTGKPIEKVEESDRRTAKVVNFGIAYGLSEYGLARDLGVSRDEAKKYIEKYFRRYSGVKKYIEDVINQAREKGYVETLYGRRRYVPEINSGDYFRQQFARRSAINAPIQGTAADLIKKAMIDLAAPLAEYDHNLLLQIHDELLLETELSDVQRVSAEVEKQMCAAVELEVPLEVEVKVGGNWAEVSK